MRYFRSHIRSRGGTVMKNERELEEHDQQEGYGFTATNAYLEGERDTREGVTHAKDEGNHVCEDPRIEAGVPLHVVVKQLVLYDIQLKLTLITFDLGLLER